MVCQTTKKQNIIIIQYYTSSYKIFIYHSEVSLMMELQNPNSRYKMIVKTVTWLKESHMLFDYEFTKNIVKDQYMISLEPSYVFIYRINAKSQVRFVKTNQFIPPRLEGTQFLGGFEIAISKQKRFKMLFHDADKFDFTPSKGQRIKTQVSNNSSQQKKEGIFFIVRSLKDNQHQPKGFVLKSGQKIKFGRIEYNVTVVKDNDKETQNPNFFDYQQTMQVQQNMRYGEDQACKICLSNEQSEPESFFCKPCDCTGSCSIVHYDCLLQWCKTKVKKAKIGKITHFNFQKFECQICKKYFPRFIQKGKNKFDLLPIDKPQKPYLVLSSQGNASQKQKSMIMINYVEQGILKVGRNQTCDIRIIDISVSRQHASIETRNGQFYLYDSKSKFGTIVSEPNFYLDVQHIKRGIQIGRSVLTFQLVQKQRDKYFNRQ